MKHRNTYQYIVLLIIVLSLSSCKVFVPHRMLTTPAGYQYSELPKNTNEEYRIAVDDEINFIIKTNNGEALVDAVGTAGAGMQNQQNSLSYIVEQDGHVRLPLIGRVKLAGLTGNEAEKLLEEKYSAFFINPFVKLKITNKRVVILKGGNSSQVIPLTHPTMTLFEAIALSGGIGDSKAHKIKLIRNSNQKTEVIRIDLSKITNINQGNIVLQANDIVYIEPRDRIPQEILNNITPYLTLATTILAIYGLFIK